VSLNCLGFGAILPEDKKTIGICRRRLLWCGLTGTLAGALAAIAGRAGGTGFPEINQGAGGLSGPFRQATLRGVRFVPTAE
jgi:hypothetical protein